MVNEISLYYDARSEKHKEVVFKFTFLSTLNLICLSTWRSQCELRKEYIILEQNYVEKSGRAVVTRV